MFSLSIVATLAFGLLPIVLGQTTLCPACVTLQSEWDPTGKTGSCLGDMSDPVKYIANFETCLCGSKGQADYAACFACDGMAVPIDGLNFGPAPAFASACSLFASDVTSVLEPSGLSAFASAVLPVLTATAGDNLDVLGFYAFENLGSTGLPQGIVTDSTISPSTPTPTPTPTASHAVTSTPAASGNGKSVSNKNRGSMVGLLGGVAVAILAAILV